MGMRLGPAPSRGDTRIILAGYVLVILAVLAVLRWCG